MARIVWSNGQSVPSPVQALRNVIAQGKGFRDQLAELNNLIAAYPSDAAIATDFGEAGADATTMHNLITQAYGELCAPGGATTQVNVGAQTGIKQLLDQFG